MHPDEPCVELVECDPHSFMKQVHDVSFTQNVLNRRRLWMMTLMVTMVMVMMKMYGGDDGDDDD